MAKEKKTTRKESAVAKKRRMEIMMAAYKVFSEKGYHATRVEDIAAELNIGYGLFYRYFENKMDVFIEVINSIIARVSQGIMVEMVSSRPKTHEEFRQYYGRLAERLIDILTEDPYLSKFLFYEALGIDEEINQKVYNALDLFGKFEASHIKKGIREGFLREDIPIEETALAVNAMILEGARRIMLSKNKAKAKRLWTDAVLNLMLRGIEKPAE